MKRLSTSKADPFNSGSHYSIRVPRKKKASTGVLPSRKQHGKIPPSIMDISGTVYCEGIQECLSASVNSIAPRIALVKFQPSICQVWIGGIPR